MEPSEVAALVREAQAGGAGAFERLAQAHRARLGAHLEHQVEDGDVVQETFLRALRSIERYRPQG